MSDSEVWMEADLLSEVDSAVTAGVSIDTIRLFRDCGLLQVVSADGEPRYSRADILALFSSPSVVSSSTADSKHFTDSSDASAELELLERRSTLDRVEVAISKDTVGEQGISGPASQGQMSESIPHSIVGPESILINSTASEEVPSVITEPSVSKFETPKILSPDNVKLEEIKTSPLAASIEVESTQATRTDLPSQNELLQANSSLLEQLQIIRSERDWLRDRVEKLEIRSEREQMLLMSESENVRKLISAPQKSFWRRALPWFGN